MSGNHKVIEQDAPDTAHSAIKTDHPFRPKNVYTNLCEVCGLAESAHAKTMVERNVRAYDYRCPDCVMMNFDPCPHQRG